MTFSVKLMTVLLTIIKRLEQPLRLCDSQSPSTWKYFDRKIRSAKIIADAKAQINLRQIVFAYVTGVNGKGLSI
jgi:hypothetical protein